MPGNWQQPITVHIPLVESHLSAGTESTLEGRRRQTGCGQSLFSGEVLNCVKGTGPIDAPPSSGTIRDCA